MERNYGARPGVADFVFVFPPDGRAKFLELKRSLSGRPSPAQLAFKAEALGAGADYAILDEIDDILNLLRAWGVLRPTA